jgi:hypothetical protein
MIKKISQLGKTLAANEQKNVKGGIILCGGTRRRCTYQFNNVDACCNWAFGLGADDFTFNPSNCQCCALYYLDPCYDGIIP